MASSPIFDNLLLLARPAAGKSEIIHYLEQLAPEIRRGKFHLGILDEIDDFPMLWTWFEEDALLEKMGKPRLHTDRDGYFLENYLWDLLIERIGLEYQKLLRDRPSGSLEHSVLIEFSRGKEHGGYQSAFQHLSPDMAGRMAILYIDVTWEESLRKNRKRFNPERPDSILEHSLPDAKLESLYKEVDWHSIAPKESGYMSIQGKHVPYVNFDNSDDVTTIGEDRLAVRLEDRLEKLWRLYQSR